MVTIVPGATLSVGGVITQNAGTTKVDGLLNLANTYSINGGSLTGTGTITGNIDNISGITQAGDSPGVLLITGSYKQEHGATFEELLGGAAAGTGYSQLTVSNLAMLDRAIDVSLINGYVPTIGEQFDVLLGSNTGTFISTTSPDSGLNYSVSYLTDRVRITINSVPEPSTFALLAIAGLLVFNRGHKRRITSD